MLFKTVFYIVLLSRIERPPAEVASTGRDKLTLPRLSGVQQYPFILYLDNRSYYNLKTAQLNQLDASDHIIDDYTLQG